MMEYDGGVHELEHENDVERIRHFQLVIAIRNHLLIFLTVTIGIVKVEIVLGSDVTMNYIENDAKILLL